MTAEEIRNDEAIENALDQCLNSLTPMEADYVRECHLRKPRLTHAKFSEKWELPPTPLTMFKAETLAKMKAILASQKIRSMGDIL